MDSSEFRDTTIIITGAGSGIGEAVTRRLHRQGANVILVGRRAARISAIASELGARAVAVPGDVARRETASAAVAAARSSFGALHGLVNAAGIFRPQPFLAHTDADLDGYLDTILRGTFVTTQAAVPAIVAAGGGAIVNVGSMWAMQAIAATPCAAYSAAKAGVHALTKNLAIELAASNVRINTVAPAVVRTPVYESFVPRDQVDAVLAGFDAFHPLGRIGTVDDLAGAITFLLGRDAAWITGVTLPVDGGVMAGRC
jgi:NAD(P)-dependent dehydrogenase (short-subunit alcohol dehydrogenase family)